MMKFIFIAVNYNGSSFTADFVQSINSIELNEEDCIRIIIVDNNSIEEDKKKLAELEELYNNVSNVFLNENIGYFGGLNKGIELVEKSKCTFLIVGNNDLTFDKDFIFNLKNIEYSKDILVIAPNIITKDGRQQNPHVIIEVPRIEKIKASIYNSNYYIGQTLRFVNQLYKKIRNKPVSLRNNLGQMRIKRGIGACYVLTPNFFEHFVKLDDRVFMWGEEALLSNQIESVGGFTLYDPSIIITHHESASVKNIQSKKRYHMVKESYKIYKKYL